MGRSDHHAGRRGGDVRHPAARFGGPLMAADAQVSVVTHARISRGRRPLPMGAVVRHAILILFCVIAITPVIWVLMMSFKSLDEAYRVPITFFPTQPTLDAYSYAFGHIPDLP